MWKLIIVLFLMMPCAFSAMIQWELSKGGNFHGYELVTGGSWTWTQAKTAALARSVNVGGVTYYGHLVAISSSAENEFLRTTFNLSTSPWIGAYQYDNLAEPTGHWAWVTGEVFSYTNWNAGEPNNSGGEDYAHILSSGAWNDLPNVSVSGYLVEYDVIVPEPASISLLGICLMAMCLRFRK